MGVQRIYRGYTPYLASELSELDYVQTADLVYLAHIDHPLNRITRGGHTDWTIAEVDFGPDIEPPVGTSAAASTPNTTDIVYQTYTYVITAAYDGSPSQESRASEEVTVSNDLSLEGNYNTLTMPAMPAGVDRYIIYKKQAGGYGYIGATDGTTFRDGSPIIQPVLSDSPPRAENPFDSVDNYPSTVTFHQQRLMAGRTRNVPNGVWGSQSADYENMDRSRPAKADDALSFALVSTKVNAVNQLISIDNDLMVLSGDAVWAVQGGDSGVLTPSDILPKRQSGRGASRLEPLDIDNVLFFVPSKGTSVRTLGYTFEIEGYQSNNISIFSPHLFRGRTVVRWAFQEDPYACIWAVLDDGTLACFTWEQEQQVWGWSLCETNGSVEDVAVITEEGYDRLYAVIRRTIAGEERLFYERMALPHFDDISTACHLDCSITQVYDPPSNVVDQLWHLEGETVSVHYDGYAEHDMLVSGGCIELPHEYEATVVTVGLRYEGEIETLPPALQTPRGSAHVNRQQVADVVVRALDTKGIEIGADGTDLEQVQERDGSEVAELPDVAARDYPVAVPGNWSDTSYIRILQREPFPAHIIGIFAKLIVSSK